MENVQNHFSRHHRSWEIARIKVYIRYREILAWGHGIYDFFMYTMVFAIAQLLRYLEKGFCTFSNSSVCAESKNGNVFYSRIRIVGSIDKTVAWHDFVIYMKCNQVIKWYKGTILSMNLLILILELYNQYFRILHREGCWKMYKTTFLVI